MLGAIAGDIIGSRFEHYPHKSKEFELFASESRFTDDTVHTVALAASLVDGVDYAPLLREYYGYYPDAGYGARFSRWALGDDPTPYNSFGNGSAMRVSPVGWFYDDLEAVLAAAQRSAAVTHSHPEGIRGAQAVAAAILLARRWHSKEAIREFVTTRFGYDLERPLEQIRPDYAFDVTCQGSVPEAIIAFLEAQSFEEAVRNAVSLGGDADTQACIAGAIAEAFFGGVPPEIAQIVWSRLDMRLLKVVRRFRDAVGA